MASVSIDVGCKKCNVVPQISTSIIYLCVFLTIDVYGLCHFGFEVGSLWLMF